MEVCVRPLPPLLLLTAVAMVIQLAGSSLAATTPFRFPANLAEAFRVEGSSGQEEGRDLPKATHDAYLKDSQTSALPSGSTSGPASGFGHTSGGTWQAEREPASGRQYSDGKSQSYGTSWNNHYQSPTKSSSYDSRYDPPESGDSNRYDDKGHHQYNYQGGDSDSGSYHSETPYGGGSYSGGTSHSGGGNYHGDGRKNYRGDEDHYDDGRQHYSSGGGSNYGGGRNNYDDGYGSDGGDGYGGSRNRNEYGGGRNDNDEVTSYTRGDNHYGGGGRNDYDGGDYGYGGGGGGRNHYDGGENHYSNDDGYGDDSHDDDYSRGGQGGHGEHEYGHGGHDEYGHGGHDHGYGGRGSGHGGTGQGSSGHSEDPVDEYAVYSPKMSGTYRRRSDPGQGGYYGIFKNRPESASGGAFERSDSRPVAYDKKRQGEGLNGERRRGEDVDRKDDFQDFSSGKKAQSLLEMINQRTEEAFGDPASEQKNAGSEEGGNRGGFVRYGVYRPAFGDLKYYSGKRDSETGTRHGKDFEGHRGSVGGFFDDTDKGGNSEHEQLKRPSGFEDFKEPEDLYEQPQYGTQKHLVDDSSKTFGGFHIPDHIFKDNPFAGQRTDDASQDSTKDHQSYGDYQANKDVMFNSGLGDHQTLQNDFKDPGSQFHFRVNDMFAKISNPFQSHGSREPEYDGEDNTSNAKLQNSDSMPHRSRYQEVAAMAREATDLPTVANEGNNLALNETEKKLVHNRTRRNTSVSDDVKASARHSEDFDGRSNNEIDLSKSKVNGPREVHPVIHRYFDGVPHMVYRDMGDEVFKSKSKSEAPDSTHRDARRFRAGIHGPRAPAFRRPGRRTHPNFGGQRSRHGTTPLYPPLTGFAQSSPVGHLQRQRNRGALRQPFPAPGHLPLHRENSGSNDRPNAQSQREVFQHQRPSPQDNLHPVQQHGQFRPPQNGPPYPSSLEHGTVSSPTSTTQRTPVHGHPTPFAGPQGTATPFHIPSQEAFQSQQPHVANHFADVQHNLHQEATTIASVFNVQGKEPDQRLKDNRVEVDGSYVFNSGKQSIPGLVSAFGFLDPISQASSVGENRRQDKVVNPEFKPGVLEHGFLPILPPKHHISRRGLSDDATRANSQVAPNETPAGAGKSSVTKDTPFPASVFADIPSDLLKFQSDPLTNNPISQTKLLTTSGSSTAEAKSPTAPQDLSITPSNPVASPSNILTSSSEKTSQSKSSSSTTDLVPAGSRRRTAYEPHYSNYKGRHGYRNYKTQQDPYKRYLPKEDENDPYFRYASRNNIQHSHDSEVPPEENDERLERHRAHDLYGRRGTERSHSGRQNRPRQTEMSEDDHDGDYVRERPRYGAEQRLSAGYGPEYAADYAEPYPGYDDGAHRDEHTEGRQNDYDYDDGDYVTENDYDDYDRRDDRHSSNNRYHDDKNNGDYHSDESDGYYGDGGRRRGGGRRNKDKFYDSGYQSGRYKEDEGKDYYGAKGDERIIDIDGEIRDEAHRGYDDSRRTVSAMLDTIAEKRGDKNCKEVAKNGMTCFQCTDAKGFQTEDCAYSSNSKDPNNQHVSYSESSSYGDSKRRGYDKHGKLKRKPSKKHQRDGGEVYDIGYDPDFDGIETDPDRGNTYNEGPDSIEGGTSHGRSEGFSGEDEEFLTPEEETQRGRYQTPGSFKSGRFRDAYADQAHSRSKRHAGHVHTSPSSHFSPRSDDRGGVVDDSYTGRALARFLSEDEHNHEVGPKSVSERPRRYPEEVPRYGDAEEVPRNGEGSPPAQRRSGGYHVRGVVPEYHRKVESSQSSGGGYDQYANGDAERQPPPPSNDDKEYDDAGHDSNGGTIGDLFDYRFGRQPISSGFAERLENEREEEEPVEYDYQYEDSRRPDYEDPDAKAYPEYDYDYQERGQEYEYQETPSQRAPTRPSDRPNRYSDYEEGPVRSARGGPGRRPSFKSRHFDDESDDISTSDNMRQGRRGAENTEHENTEHTNSDETDHGSGEGTYRNNDSGDDDSAATYNSDERHERRQADERDNSAKEREHARDMEPLNDEPAPYETHSYDNPDVTRSYEVSLQRRPSLTDDLGTPRGYLHSDSAPVNSRSEEGYRDGSGVRYDRPETYDKMNRGSAMTQQYRDPGREFFRSHPVGFEHFPIFNYVESEKKTN